MSAINDFDIDDFWKAEDVYSKMVDCFKKRANQEGDET